MLILSRKTSEAILIADDIEIRIMRVDGDVVKLGIEAPRSIPIVRKELFEEMSEANKEALKSSALKAANRAASKAKLSGLAQSLAKKKTNEAAGAAKS